jgi:hypothetical protein
MRSAQQGQLRRSSSSVSTRSLSGGGAAVVVGQQLQQNKKGRGAENVWRPRLSCSPRRPWFAVGVLVGAWVLLSNLIAMKIGNSNRQLHTRRVTSTTTNKRGFDPDFAAKITKIMALPTMVTPNDDAASKQKEGLAPAAPADVQLVQAPEWNIQYQEWDAICTLKRYPHLFKKFCKTRKPSTCNVEAFQAYFKDRSAEEDIVGGCPLAEAVCYAKRYMDLYGAYCKGQDTTCDYYALRLHYDIAGAHEHRAWGCDFVQKQQQPIDSTEKTLLRLRSHGLLP